jgi:type I restriction enzyme, S subunit
LKEVEIGLVARIETGTTPSTKKPEYHGGNIPFIKPGDLHEQPKVIFDAESFVTELGAEQGRIIPKNGVMVCCIGSLGKLAIAGRNMITNQQINSVIFNEDKIDPKFGAYFLATQKKELEHLASSTTVAIVNKTNFSKLKIPLPTLSEQKAIVAKLDRAQRLIDIDREMLAKYDELIQSVFLEMFGDPVRNEKGWKRKPMQKIGEMKSGGTPSRKNKEYFTGGIDWYTTGELESMYLGEAEEKITETAINESSAKLFEKGSLLIGMYDTSAFKLGILTGPGSSNQASANIKLDPEICNVEWLYYCLKIMRPSILHERRGIRQKNLTLGFLKKLEIIIPPLEKQLQFSRSLNKISEEKKTTKSISKKTEELFSSLVQGVYG